MFKYAEYSNNVHDPCTWKYNAQWFVPQRLKGAVYN